MNELYLVTKFDIASGDATELATDPDRELATAAFQAESMDLNVQNPTPILLERKITREDGKVKLELLNAVVIYPTQTLRKEWGKNPGVEFEYRELYDRILEVRNLLFGYTNYGETTLNDEQEALPE